MRAPLKMKTRERIPGNPANRPHNDPLRETSGKLYSAKRRPACSSCKLRGAERSKERGILAAKGKGILRYRGASCLVQNCRISATTPIRDTPCTICTYGIYLLGMESRYDTSPGCSSRRANRARVIPRQTSGQCFKRDRNIVLRLERKSIPVARLHAHAHVCICMYARCTHKVISCNQEYRRLVIVACIGILFDGKRALDREQ